jgi:ABC-2 type transport system ATP-binding protein
MEGRLRLLMAHRGDGDGPAVRLERISKSFGQIKAVDGLSMEVQRGTIHGLLGPNAAGKTTTIKLMTGKLKPDSGSATVLGQRMPEGYPKIAASVGVMPQGQALYGDLSLVQNLSFFAALQDMRGLGAKTRIDELLKLMRIEDEADRAVYALSGGTKQRVSLACSLLHSPSLLFLDEPTVGIDPLLRRVFWDYFRRLRDGGTTIIMTTHYIQEAESCDFVSLLREGRLVADGEPADLKKRYGLDTLEEVFVKLSEAGIDG